MTGRSLADAQQTAKQVKDVKPTEWSPCHGLETLPFCCLALFWKLLGNGTISSMDKFNHWLKNDGQRLVTVLVWISSKMHNSSANKNVYGSLSLFQTMLKLSTTFQTLLFCSPWLLSFPLKSKFKRGTVKNVHPSSILDFFRIRKRKRFQTNVKILCHRCTSSCNIVLFLWVWKNIAIRWRSAFSCMFVFQ